MEGGGRPAADGEEEAVAGERPPARSAAGAGGVTLGGAEEVASSAGEEEPPGEAAAALPEAVANPKGLELTDREVLFMQSLAPVIGRSPRTAKRFVNVYRLLRCSLPDWRLERFLGGDDEPGDFRAAMLLLALVVGCPGAARVLFPRLLAAPPEMPLPELIDQVPALSSPTRQWRAFGDLFDNDSQPWIVGEWNAGELQSWIAEVGRFSFRVGHGAGPPEVGPR
jgi:hypothetical protein